MKSDSLDIVALCEKLISIDSINPFRTDTLDDGSFHIHGNETEIFEFCEQYLQDAGFRTSRQDCGGGRQNLLAEKGEGSKAFLLYAHVDTVEVKEGWTREEALTPRRGHLEVDGEEHEVIYGLGSNDMKAGVALLLRLAATFEPTDFRLKIVLGCDEEYWSLGSHCLVHESDFLDDVFGVLVPEVGEAATEPEAGSMLATLGRCGRAESVIQVPGTGGHGAEPDRPDRVNALTQVAEIVLAVEKMSRAFPYFYPFGKELGQAVRASALVTRVEGGQGLLSVPDQAEIIVNHVLVPGETAETAKSMLEALIQDLRIDGRLRPVLLGNETVWPTVRTRERPTPPLKPYVMDLEQPFVRWVLKCIQDKDVLEKGMGVSVADENRFGAEAHLPVIVLGPRGENAHAAYEWVSIPSMQRLEATYLRILKSLPAFLKDESTS